jgi:hypothetical protein
VRFDDAREIDSICWQIRSADFPRGLNRARIDELFGGWPPFSGEEVEKNNTAVNVNFGEPMRLAHDARSQFSNAFTKPGLFFTARTDYGKNHNRQKYGSIVTRKINRIMKRSLPYYECNRSSFALDVLHGIGPSAWPDQDALLPEPQAISDVGIPARTYLHMRNLPFFYLFRLFTHQESKKLTPGPERYPGWHMGLVERALEWCEKQTLELIGQNWSDYWSPEKVSEAVKGDGGFFVGDQVPTIDTFDFYYYDDDSKDAGWRRRIILDSWSTPEAAGGTWKAVRKADEPFRSKSDFLYSSNNTKFADKRENIIAFQFADLSAVAPFQYHSVRSLGFLLYSICHLQNRYRCAFTEAAFENLLQMFRIKSEEDIQRALKLKLHGFAFVDENLMPLTQQERFHPDKNFAEMALNENSRLIDQHSSSYVQNPSAGQQGVDKTKFQVLAETNAMTTMTGAPLAPADDLCDLHGPTTERL